MSYDCYGRNTSEAAKEEMMSNSEIASIISASISAVTTIITLIIGANLSKYKDFYKSKLDESMESHKNALLIQTETIKYELGNQTEMLKSELGNQTEDFKTTLSYFGTVDTELRNLRIKSYSELWRMTSAVPRWPIDKSLTYSGIHDYSEKLRDWYFGKDSETPGGMLLTEDAAQAYRELQDQIDEVYKARSGDATATLKEDHYQTIRQRGSTLRTELTKDLLSRRAVPDEKDAKRLSETDSAIEKTTDPETKMPELTTK